MMYTNFKDTDDDDAVMTASLNETTKAEVIDTLPPPTNAATVSTPTPPSTPSLVDKNCTETTLRFSTTRPDLAAGSTDMQTVLGPYINRHTLKGLDAALLERNMQIRHDLMLDPVLRASLPSRAPNDDAMRDEYWSSLRLELAELQLPEVHNAPRLRLLIAEIRELMVELYPRCEMVRGELVELMDEDLVIQQLKHGLFDLSAFFDFLARAMKKNCAPKRDGLVDSMLASGQLGAHMDALRICLDLLECMKLDLANYKLDLLRPSVAKSAISTERNYFANLFTSKKLSLELTRHWLEQTRECHETCRGECRGACHKECRGACREGCHAPQSMSPHEVYLEAALRLLVTPFVRDTSVPETFLLDKKRLVALHSKFQDLCIVQCLLLIYKQATAGATRSLHTEKLRSDLLVQLENTETQISNISELVAAAIAVHKGQHAVSPADYNLVHASINKIIAPDNQLFLLVEQRLLAFVRQSVSNEDANMTESPPSVKLSDLNVLDQLGDVANRFTSLLAYNWHVFEPLYRQLLSCSP